MPRAASSADQEQIDYAAQFGFEVTPRQLERWRQAGALPPRLRPGKGQGRGRAAINPPHACGQLVLLCRMLQATPRLREATLWAWYFGGQVPIALIKQWVTECLEGHERTRQQIRRELDQAHAERGDYPPDEFDVAQREPVMATPRVPRSERAAARAAAQLLKTEEDKDPPRARDALISARTQMTQAFSGDEDVEPHFPALAASMRFEALDDLEGRPPGISEVELQNTLPHLNARNLIAEVSSASEGDLLRAREFLRSNFDLVQAMRRSASEPIRLQGENTDVLYDPRDPDYTEARLLVALAATLLLWRLETSGKQN